MIQAKCIHKFRDKNGLIYGYRLIDINGQTQDVTPDDLKKAINNKQITVVNLTLTSDNRLIDKPAEKQLQNKNIMPNKVEKSQSKMNERIVKYVGRYADMITKDLCNCDAKLFSCDDTLPGFVDAIYDLPGIEYDGCGEVKLHIGYTYSKEEKLIRIGLLNMEEFYTKDLAIASLENSLGLRGEIDQAIKVFEIKAKSYSNWEDIVETKLIIRKA